jgi:sensor histidine kinase regulating citrate/malate metabolism
MSYDKFVEICSDDESTLHPDIMSFSSIISKYNNLVRESPKVDFIEERLSYVSSGMIMNALDSLKIKNAYSNFIRKIKMHLYTDDKRVRFAIEDNGMGIASVVQDQLFKERISSQKHFLKIPLIGGEGIHMYQSKNKINALNGDIGFLNLDEGVIFWYEVPLQ